MLSTYHNERLTSTVKRGDPSSQFLNVDKPYMIMLKPAGRGRGHRRELTLFCHPFAHRAQRAEAGIGA